MKLYVNRNTDPYFNLAAEQYLMEHEDDEVFMLWRNDRSIIIGRNQNAYAEINRTFVDEHAIPVVRRLTGGGAVFHDLGNLCFTFIVKHEAGQVMDFSRFCRPIIESLQSLGVPAALSGRNDMTVEGRKFSGNAECVLGEKILHHGTILFSADLSFLSGALQVREDKMRSKGIKSVRSRVCNLSSYLPDLTVTDLMEHLARSVVAERATFADEQIEGIQALVQSKYRTWEWNYGVSKQYEKQVMHRFPYGSVELSYTADRGILKAVKLEGDFFAIGDVSAWETALLGCPLKRESLAERLRDAGEILHGISSEDLLSLFMSE